MSVKDKGVRNLFLVVTCGEDYTFETLDAIKKETTIPFQLQVWYAIKKPLDVNFYERLLTYTDDVIVSSAKHPFASCQGWAMVYNDYDFLWVFSCDSKPMPGYVEKVDHAFMFVPYTVLVGNQKFASQPDFMISETGCVPDLLQVFSRDGVNLLGGMCPSFRTNGHEVVEMGLRIVQSRFQFISMKGLVEEIGPTAPHNGGKNDYNPKNVLDNLEIVNHCRDIVNNGLAYNWWSNKVMDLPRTKEEKQEKLEKEFVCL